VKQNEVEIGLRSGFPPADASHRGERQAFDAVRHRDKVLGKTRVQERGYRLSSLFTGTVGER